MKNIIQNLSNIRLSPLPPPLEVAGGECVLERIDSTESFGVHITSIHINDSISMFVKSIIKDSIADKTQKINIYDEIMEEEEEIRRMLNFDLKIKLKLKRDLNRIKEVLVDKWSKELLLSEGEMIVVDFIDKTQTTCLGISLEGTVDIENGKEMCSHHFIRSILKEGPVDKSNSFKDGDELLEINGRDLFNISYIELLDILKHLPMKMLLLVCCRGGGGGVGRKKEEKKKFTMPQPPTGRTPPVRSRSLELTGLAMWNLKILNIELNKTDKGLGFSIIDYKDQFNSNNNNNAIVIRSLVPNGVAQLDGRILPGCRLVSVNSTSLENSSLDFAVKCLKEAPKGLVKLGIQKPLPYPYTIHDLDKKTKSEACMLLSSNIEEATYDDVKRSDDDDDDEEGGFIATSAPAILSNNNRIHYNNYLLENIIDDDGSELDDDFFSNVNSNYPNDDDDDDDYDDNLTDTTNTSCASSNSIKSSLITPPPPPPLPIEVDFDKHEYGDFVYSYENIRLFNNMVRERERENYFYLIYYSISLHLKTFFL